MELIGLITTALPLVLKYAPHLAGLFGGPTAGTAAGQVIEAAKNVFGTTDPKDIEAQIAADNNKLEKFKVEAEARTKETQLFLQDVQSARMMNMEAIRAGSKIAWIPVVISGFIFLIFILAFYISVFERISTNNVAAQQMVGAIILAFGNAISFWLGSSKGSDDKTGTLSAMLASMQSTNAKVVNKLSDQTEQKMFK